MVVQVCFDETIWTFSAKHKVKTSVFRYLQRKSLKRSFFIFKQYFSVRSNHFSKVYLINRPQSITNLRVMYCAFSVSRVQAPQYATLHACAMSNVFPFTRTTMTLFVYRWAFPLLLSFLEYHYSRMQPIVENSIPLGIAPKMLCSYVDFLGHWKNASTTLRFFTTYLNSSQKKYNIHTRFL